MFVEVEQEKATGGGSLFVNMDRVTTAHLSADGKTLMVAFGPGDHHPFQGEDNIKRLLAVLRAAPHLPGR